MDFTEHVIISAAGSAAIAMSGAGWEAAASFGVLGVFIDLDHFPDYWRENGWKLDLPHFFDFFSRYQAKKLVVALHAWEWIALAAVVAYYFKAVPWVDWGIAGWLLHLMLDQRFNEQHPLAYFFCFRAARRFRTDSGNE